MGKKWVEPSGTHKDAYSHESLARGEIPDYVFDEALWKTIETTNDCKILLSNMVGVLQQARWILKTHGAGHSNPLAKELVDSAFDAREIESIEGLRHNALKAIRAVENARGCVKGARFSAAVKEIERGGFSLAQIAGASRVSELR